MDDLLNSNFYFFWSQKTFFDRLRTLNTRSDYLLITAKETSSAAAATNKEDPIRWFGGVFPNKHKKGADAVISKTVAKRVRDEKRDCAQ